MRRALYQWILLLVCCASFLVNAERRSRWIWRGLIGLTVIAGDVRRDAVAFAVSAPAGRGWAVGDSTCPRWRVVTDGDSGLVA